MIEYIFFEVPLRNAFVEYAKSLGIDCTLHDDPMGMIVAIAEDTAEDLEEALEQRYDELQEEQSRLLAEEEGGLRQLAGFRFNLPDGQSRLVPLQPDIANRLMAGFSLDEIQALFEAVARSAMSTAEDHLCKVLAAEKEHSAK
ncbi:MAG TPA: hypothetical protein VMW07_09870 [Gallionella sp.]|jgi:hypothetical protein|nr:hypothetical protein [Gallionella sp.]